MNHLLRPRIWTSFLASSGIGPCDVRLKLPAVPPRRDRESSKCKEVIPFYCSSLANPAASYGECARPVEFPEGNPIPQGELVQFKICNKRFIRRSASEGMGVDVSY